MFLFFVSFIALIIGLIRPTLLSKIIKSPSRKKVGWIFGVATVTLFILIGVFADPSQKKVNNDNKTDNQQNVNINQNNDSQVTEDNSVVSLSGDLYSVVSVVDGDTIDVMLNNKTERLRLIGMDTPETKDPRKPVQCFGQEASNKATELLLNKKVRLEADDTQDNVDKYDRLLRYVYLEDGLFFNKWMIENGYAYEYTYNVPYKYQVEFKQAQITAKDKQLGLWDPNTCNGSTLLDNSSDEQVKTDTNQTTPTTPVPVSNTDCDIKGNISASGEKIYHVIGCGSYARTVIDESKGERWFCSEQEAVNAGWRKAQNCP